MKYLSVCSGIEAASVAWEPLGWEPVLFSEIEPFPVAVLKHRQRGVDARETGAAARGVPIWGDFTALRMRHLRRMGILPDMLCGGTPCQAFSVAGLRQSLSDDRGNLTLQFILLANAIDNLRHAAGKEPGWVMWENVPGVLSTADNAFGAFLGGLCGSDSAIPKPADGWGDSGVVDGPTRVVAFRILDAQFFGLAQRRRRVFVLARGGAGKWAAADALLPIIESSRWHPAPSLRSGERIAPTVSTSSTGGGGPRGDFHYDGGLVACDTADTLTVGANQTTGFVGDVVAHSLPMVLGDANTNASISRDRWTTITAHASQDAPILVRTREGKEGGGKGPLVSEDRSLTLATSNDQILAFNSRASASDTGIPQVDATPTVRTEGAIAVAFMENIRGEVRTSDQTDALTLGGGKPGQGYAAAQIGMQVRRLTPMECERLQGFPDGYTEVPWRGKEETADGPRYKSIGNSWAVTCARYIGTRIHAVTSKP